MFALPVFAAASLWSAQSKDYGSGNADFTLREIERRPNSSVLQLDIRIRGSSVGSSMITACMLMRLAQERGGYRYLVKIDALPSNPKQMLVGFSHVANVKPQTLDAELSDSAMEVDLELFGSDLNKKCRANVN